LGPLDLITNNTKKNFVNREFKEYTNIISIRTKVILVEIYNSISIIERYYSLLQQVYQIIVVELPGIDRDIALQIVFKALNNTISPDSLVLILLVFGAYLRITELDAPLPIVI
jgi:hypothetical protein